MGRGRESVGGPCRDLSEDARLSIVGCTTFDVRQVSAPTETAPWINSSPRTEAPPSARRRSLLVALPSGGASALQKSGESRRLVLLLGESQSDLVARQGFPIDQDVAKAHMDLETLLDLQRISNERIGDKPVCDEKFTEPPG